MIAEGWLSRLQRGRPVGRRPPSAARVARSRSLPRPGARTLVAAAVAIVLLGGIWLWLRDSSLVSVNRVTVAQPSGPDAGRIRSALITAARSMTTLDVQLGQLRTAVAPYPVVKDLQVSTQFPHGMRIRVIEQSPVGAIVVGGRTIAVAGDGTLLHDLPPSTTLPAIPLRVPPGGTRLSDRGALDAVAVLATAPYQLLSRLSQVSQVAGHGLVAQLRNGPSIYFGDATRLASKWIAATAVLADSGSAGAVYIDVTDPARPVAGGQSPSTGTATSAATGTTTSAATGTAASGSTGAAASGSSSASPASTTTSPGG